jgi:Cyclopropane fatty acid synthase and related methyltransferases
MMYGETYGYRSGLNASMVAHLERKISILESQFGVQPGDTVLDIGANDATTLKAYRTPGLKRLGIDPSAEKFRSFYTEDISLEVDFFTADAYRRLSDTPAKLITSIAMFYDLPDPVAFAKDIASVLATDGIWHFEQSYLPIMLAMTSYDTICQEHLEYYSLDVVRQILDAADLQILDVTTNDINGGSFAVTAGHKGTTYPVSNLETVDWMLAQEEHLGLRTRAPYEAFAGRMTEQRDQLLGLLKALKDSGKRVLGLGASTKGNVILQYCGIGTDLMTQYLT